MTVPRRIAVGFDGSPGARAAVDWAAALAGRLGAVLIVLHAEGLLERLAGAGGDPVEESVVDALAGSGLGPGRVERARVDGDPVSALLRAGQPPIDADLLVVGSRGMAAHRGRVLGSTGVELAEHATTPLVIVPQP